MAYLDHFAPVAQAVVHHRHFRGILDRKASAALFDIISRQSDDFRREFLTGIVRFFRSSVGNGAGRVYLNIGHTGLDSHGFLKWVSKTDVRPIYFVHDLIPITHPQFCRDGEEARHRKRMSTVLKTGCGVIGNSQATLDELTRFARMENLPELPGVAAWLGTTRFESRTLSEPAPDRAIFVIVGTIEARKNHLLLLNIWKRLVARFGSQAPRLLIIGQRGWEAEHVFNVLDRDETLRGHVAELGACSDDELSSHLRSARALLFPSHAEGYGLPLVEALGLGVPVIASDLPVFREIGQGIPGLLPTGDETAWQTAILDFVRPESASRTAQLERMKRFAAPNWSSHFNEVERWLSSCP